MRRPVLFSTLALGAVIAVLGASGTWATFDDTARSQEITIDSFEYVELNPVDIRIADQRPDGSCPTDPAAYRDGNEAFAPIRLEYNRDGQLDGVTRQEALTADLCVMYLGSEPFASASLITEILVDDDPYCSGEEETVVGETCGLRFPAGPTPGELDDAYTITVREHRWDSLRRAGYTCAGGGVTQSATLADLRDGERAALDLSTRWLSFAEDTCTPEPMSRDALRIISFHLSLAYDPGFGGRDAAAVARVAQTDRVTFRYVIAAIRQQHT